MASAFERHDLSSRRGRVLVAGDVHGRFDDLSRALDRCRYDEASDSLVLLGDLINKGPDSHLAMHWACNLRVLGNHETSLRDLEADALGTAYGKMSWLARVGGVAERRAFARRLADAPVMMEVLLPSGRTAGFIHAGVPYMDWAVARDLVRDVAHPQHRDAIRLATTDRDHAQGVLTGMRGAVVGIDHVFLGHTPLPTPVAIGNTTLCDTSRSPQRVTVIDVDLWLDAHHQGEIA